MASTSASTDLGGSKTFTGESEDGKEYKRWKQSVTNKLMTLQEKLPAKAHGAYVYTLLGGKALETVEHLEDSEFHREGGEKVLFKLLDERFPTKDSADELSENMTKIFELRAAEGESMKVWISRATDAFEILKRKTSVSFPEEARGWIILNRAGLSAEQRAIVLARSQGSLKREDIGKSLRSCYPDLVVKKKVFGASAVADESALLDDEEELIEAPGDFDDVEQFLADATDGIDDAGEDVYEEDEIKDILAVTWQERRKSLAKLQKSRRFTEAGQVKRQFRVEVEELKKRTKCHRCGAVGHWSRECKLPFNRAAGKGTAKGSGKSSTSSSSKPDVGAAVVEHFIASVNDEPSMVQKLAHQRLSRSSDGSLDSEPVEQLLVSQPWLRCTRLRVW